MALDWGGRLSPQAERIALGPATRRRAIIACLAGNLFEIFDFGVYGYFAVQIGRAVFPSADPVASLLAAFATYGVGL